MTAPPSNNDQPTERDATLIRPLWEERVAEQAARARITRTVDELEEALARLTHPSATAHMTPGTAAQARRASRAGKTLARLAQGHDKTG